MSVNSELAASAAKLQQTSPFIELLILDATNLGGQIYHFCNFRGADGNGPTFGGQYYTPFPAITSGWDYSTTGAFVRPTLSLSMVDSTLLAATVSLGDLVSAGLTRLRTYEKHLDGGSEANPSAYWGPDKMVIFEMTAQDPENINYTLAMKVDRKDMRFPGRQILKDVSVKNLYAPGVSRNRIR